MLRRGGNMDYKEELQRILADMEERRLQCLKELKRLPKGELHINKAGKYLQYRRFIRKNGQIVRTSIGKNPELILKMKRRALIEAEVKNLDGDIPKVRQTANTVKGNDFEIIRESLKHGLGNLEKDDYFVQTAGGLFIPKPVRDPDVRIRRLELHLGDIDPYEWGIMPYRENTSYLGDKHHVGMTGLNYRSRAELHIFEHIITKRRHPVHYDEVIEIDGEFFSPDGIAPNLKGEIILIEYVEKDDENYLKRNARKFDAYRSKGFVMGRNLLIITCETNDFINTPKLDKMLDAYLLT